jgi:hypothetical protein
MGVTYQILINLLINIYSTTYLKSVEINVSGDFS